MVQLTRRRFLQAAAWAGGVALQGAIPSVAAVRGPRVPVPSALDGTTAILKEIIGTYTRVEDDPWVLMHGVRAMGRDFTIKGENAVDFLCSRFLKQRTVAGKPYLYMPLEQEGHTHAFLKTVLEAGVATSHRFRLAGRRHTVGDLVTHAKALFTFDPKMIDPDDIAWTLIAFSLQIDPSRETWTNAEGQRIRFSDLVRFGFDTLDGATAQLKRARAQGMLPDAKDRIHDFTCGGTHLLYGLTSCVGNGYRGHDFPRRLQEHLDLHIWRLEADSQMIDRFYRRAPLAFDSPPSLKKVQALYHSDANIKFLGHSFEILSYARHRGLLGPTPVLGRAIEKAATTLADAVKGIKGVDLFEIRKSNLRLFHLLIGDACHACHGVHMVPGVNQV